MAFAQNKKNYDRLDYDYLATMANSKKYLGYPPTDGLGNAAQSKRRQVVEALARPIVETLKKTTTNKGKDKASEPS